MSVEDEEAGEFYTDAVTGRRRRKRGKRDTPRGPYSGAEKRMIQSWRLLVARLHHMDGELSDLTASRITVIVTGWRLAMERYSTVNLPDPTPEDWVSLREELGIPEEFPGEDVGGFDIGNLQLRVLARVRDRAKLSALATQMRARKIHAQKGPAQTGQGPIASAPRVRPCVPETPGMCRTK
jgi:hypothetical protein